MKTRVLSVAILTIVALLMVAGVAQAVSATTLTIVKDAQDGHIDGTYTKAQVQTALNYVKSDPTLEQYSNVEGVLADYLASLSAPGAQSGGLMFTGGSTVLIFASGIALIGGGLLLRRRLASSPS